MATSNVGLNMNTSAFFITLGNEPIESFYKKHTIFGEVVEGLEVLDKLNKVMVEEKSLRPY